MAPRHLMLRRAHRARFSVVTIKPFGNTKSFFAILSADSWPDHVPVPSFGPRMVCTRCGIICADARPNWREQPARLSGPGTAPWQ
jgi:hypothetical protein